MSTSSSAPLGSLRLQAQQRADMESNPAISTSEWNSYISNSHKELTDLLVAAYDNNYHFAEPYQFLTTNSQFYPLPDGTPDFTNTVGDTAKKFYKLLGVDLQYSSSPSGWVTLRKIQFIERNKYAYPNSAVNWNGYSNLKYMVQGNNLELIPVPMPGQTVQLWYIPAPNALQYQLASGTTLQSGVITLSDTTGLSVGMNVSGQGIPTNATISVVGSTSVQITASASATYASAILSYWDDSTLLDGIAGWEEFVIIDAAIKAQIKQENDITPLVMQKNDMKARIESMAEGRDAGQAFHVSDVLGSNNSGWGGWGGSDGFGGDGY